MVIVPKTLKEAGAVLKQLATQRSHVTLYVLVPGDDGAQIASDADIRAENHPFRKVAWITEPATLGLPGCEVLKQARDDGAAVSVMTFDNRLSSVLPASGDVDLVAIERAFIKAEQDA
ncbi:MAG: hypothetical protein ABW061_15115 [Polyangiaceae bacterium]